MKLSVYKLGRIEYTKALKLQKMLLKLRQQQKIVDILLVLEHPSVLTLGRNANQSNILVAKDILQARGIDIHETNRGGDVTYHGPGQIIGYPIIDLNNHGKDVHNFIWNIEEVFVRLLKEQYNIDTKRFSEHKGVWVGNNKITALGFSVKRWVTMHGFTFNVNTDLEYFKMINPCGISDKGVTSIQKLLDHCENYDKAIDVVVRYFCQVFNLEPEILYKLDSRDKKLEDD
ncbi:lipoyl(octanoyl) transferase LipB [Clostridium magnum]|uniref:Octanoyltransferase n=1 Tax=Clostridium magnum DSM 2767 TaxID=1121326 RepID=A0A162R0Z8_9CLOT|nr:lipoyl(octanoyl) transferase LipB [Clostridium magnum]KZL89259.1 octanoyltransferase [Clostridium magnum DSM 2767]SHI97189.1 lipoyl(octanoyl) transferase [Clostridium magnum DSM 2767]